MIVGTAITVYVVFAVVQLVKRRSQASQQS